MTTSATTQRTTVVRLPRARLRASGALYEGQRAVEEKGGGGSPGDGWTSATAAPHPGEPVTHELPGWVHDLNAVERRIDARADDPPGRAGWLDVGHIAGSLGVLLYLGPTPRADLAEWALATTRRLLAQLPAPTVLAEPHDFLLTRFYFGTPTAAPCADLLHHCAAALADALDNGRAPLDLADVLLDTAVALDAYLVATRALDAAARYTDPALDRAPEPAARPPAAPATRPRRGGAAHR